MACKESLTSMLLIKQQNIAPSVSLATSHSMYALALVSVSKRYQVGCTRLSYRICQGSVIGHLSHLLYFLQLNFPNNIEDKGNIFDDKNYSYKHVKYPKKIAVFLS